MATLRLTNDERMELEELLTGIGARLVRLPRVILNIPHSGARDMTLSELRLHPRTFASLLRKKLIVKDRHNVDIFGISQRGRLVMGEK